MMWLWFFIGVLVGVSLGVIFMVILIVGKDAEAHYEK